MYRKTELNADQARAAVWQAICALKSAAEKVSYTAIGVYLEKNKKIFTTYQDVVEQLKNLEKDQALVLDANYNVVKINPQ